MSKVSKFRRKSIERGNHVERAQKLRGILILFAGVAGNNASVIEVPLP